MIKIGKNAKFGGIEISFPDIPSKEVRTWLKSKGFQWGKYNKVWWIKYNESKWILVHEYFEIPLPSENLSTEPEKLKSFAEYLTEGREVYGWKNNEAIHEMYKIYLLRNAYDDEIRLDNFGTGIVKKIDDAQRGISINLSKVGIVDETSFVYGKRKVAELMDRARSEGKSIKPEKENMKKETIGRKEFWQMTKADFRKYWILLWEAWQPKEQVIKSASSRKWYANRPDGSVTTAWVSKKLAISMLTNEKAGMKALIENGNMDWEHKAHIENAIKDNKPVPEEVLNEYPDLKKEPFFQDVSVIAPEKDPEKPEGIILPMTKDEIIEKLTELARKSTSDLNFVNATRFLAANYGIDNTSDQFVEAMGLVRGDPAKNLEILKHFYRTQGLHAKREHKKEVAQSKAEFDVARIEEMANEAFEEGNKEILDENKVGTIRPDFMEGILKGREIQLSMPNGEKRNAIFAIAELAEIIASHNEENFHSEPLFPKNAAGNNINDRNYKDDLSAQKAVMDYARELEPERLITTSRTPSGTPIVSKDGFVVSGNNRTMSLKLAAKQHPENYKEYIKYLAEEIESFGFPTSIGVALSNGYKITTEGGSIETMEEIQFTYPVLVRIDLNFPEYTTQELAKYNKDTKKSERPVDKAIKLSNILRENSRCAEIIAEIVGDYDTFSEFYLNIIAQKKLARTLIDCNLLITQELPAFFSETTFTENGKEFIENLLAALILDREALLSTEQPGVKAIRQKLITALPVLMKNSGLPEGSLKSNINEAVILQQIIKASGLEFNDWIRQQDLFGKTYDRKTVYLNRLANEGKIVFKQAIEKYNDAVMQNQGETLFGTKPSLEDIFNQFIGSRIDDTEKRLIKASEKITKDDFKLSPEQIEKIKPEWDKMQAFIKDSDAELAEQKQSDIAPGFNEETKKIYFRAIGRGFIVKSLNEVQYKPIGKEGFCEQNTYNAVKANTNIYFPVGGYMIQHGTSLVEHWWIYDKKQNKHIEVTPLGEDREKWLTGYIGIINFDINDEIVNSRDYYDGPDFLKGGHVYHKYLKEDTQINEEQKEIIGIAAKFKVGDIVRYKQGDIDIEHWYGIIKEVRQLGKENLYRIDGYALNSAGSVMFDSEKTNEKYEAQLTILSTVSLYQGLKSEYELHKVFLREENGVKIYLVDGEAVRKDHIEFTMGGHGYVYDYIPKTDCWIDENLKSKPDDMEATIRHEIFEIGKMRDEGMSYEDAHELANNVEKQKRQDMDSKIYTAKELNELYSYGKGFNLSYLEIDSFSSGTFTRYYKVSKLRGTYPDFERDKFKSPLFDDYKWYIEFAEGQYKETVNPYTKEETLESETELPPIKALPKKYARLNRPLNNRQEGDEGEVVSQPNMFVSDLLFADGKKERIDNTYLEFIKKPDTKDFIKQHIIIAKPSHGEKPKDDIAAMGKEVTNESTKFDFVVLENGVIKFGSKEAAEKILSKAPVLKIGYGVSFIGKEYTKVQLGETMPDGWYGSKPRDGQGNRLPFQPLMFKTVLNYIPDISAVETEEQNDWIDSFTWRYDVVNGDFTNYLTDKKPTHDSITNIVQPYTIWQIAKYDSGEKFDNLLIGFESLDEAKLWMQYYREKEANGNDLVKQPTVFKYGQKYEGFAESTAQIMIKKGDIDKDYDWTIQKYHDRYKGERYYLKGTLKAQVSKPETTFLLEGQSGIQPREISLHVRNGKTNKIYFNFDDANKGMRELLDNENFSDLEYDIIFKDGETLSGVIDCEPRSFFTNEQYPLSRHLKTFWGNVAKSTPNALAQQDDIDFAQRIYQNYNLGTTKMTVSKPEVKDIFPEIAEQGDKERLIEEIQSLEKNIRNGLNLMTNPRFTGDVRPDIEKDRQRVIKKQQQLADLLGISFTDIDDYIQKQSHPEVAPSFENWTKDIISSLKKTSIDGTEGYFITDNSGNVMLFPDVSSAEYYGSNGQINPMSSISGFNVVKRKYKSENTGKVTISYAIKVNESNFNSSIKEEPILLKSLIASLNPSDYKTPFDINKGIETLLDRKWPSGPDAFSAEEKAFIALYSGYGGLDDEARAAGQKLDVKSLFEFYTPDKVIEKMWGLAYKHGYKEGPLCEPSVSVGRFLKREFVKSHVPKTGYEINKYASKICKILYPETNINDGEEIKYFEQVFLKNNYTVRDKVTPLYDLVIGNPPYGKVGGTYMGMGEATYSHAKNYIDYFIFRGLDLLKPEGLLIYIVGAEVAVGGKPWLDQGPSKCKEMIAKKGKLIDAYRLPEGLFDRTNVVCDILVFRKR